MNMPLEVCEGRDPKGLYKLARAGKLKGVSFQSIICLWDITVLLVSFTKFSELGKITFPKISRNVAPKKTVNIEVH